MNQRSQSPRNLSYSPKDSIFLLAASLLSLFCMNLRASNFPEVGRLISLFEIHDALELTRQKLALHPDDPFLLEKAGELSFRVGEYVAGSEYFKRLFAVSSEPAAVLVLLARAQEDASLYEQASEVARRAIELDADVSGARAVLSRCLLAGLHHEKVCDLLAPRVEEGSEDLEERLAYGRALIGIGEFDKAAKVLAGPAESPEAEVAVRLSYAEALNGSRKYERAADVLVSLLEEDPALIQAYYLVGTALMRTGRTEMADALLETYRSMQNLEDRRYFPDMEAAGLRNQVLYERAILDLHKGQYAQAFSGFRRSAALKPGDGPVVLAAAAQLAEMEATWEAQEILDRGIEENVEPAADFLFQKGEVFCRSGQLDQAQTWFEKALKGDPNHTGALLRMGQVLLSGNQSAEDADSFLTRARERAPEQWEPIYWLGRTALERGQTAIALSRFQEAIQVRGDTNAEISCFLGLARLRAGSAEVGSRLLLESMKMDRTSPETLGGLEEGLSVLGDPVGATKAREMKEIAEKIRERVARTRRDQCAFDQKGEAFLEAARLYLQLGSLGDAVKYLRLARAASPDNIEPYRALAEMATAPGECFFRANNLGNILRLNPRDESAAGALAALYSQLGVRLKRGVELARLSLGAGSSPEGSYVLAELLFQVGDLEAANREVETALEHSPNDKRLKDLAAKLAVALRGQVESVKY